MTVQGYSVVDGIPISAFWKHHQADQSCARLRFRHSEAIPYFQSAGSMGCFVLPFVNFWSSVRLSMWENPTASNGPATRGAIHAPLRKST